MGITKHISPKTSANLHTNCIHISHSQAVPRFNFRFVQREEERSATKSWWSFEYTFEVGGRGEGGLRINHSPQPQPIPLCRGLCCTRETKCRNKHTIALMEMCCAGFWVSKTENPQTLGLFRSNWVKLCVFDSKFSYTSCALWGCGAIYCWCGAARPWGWGVTICRHREKDVRAKHELP